MWALENLLLAARFAAPEPLRHISYSHPFLHRPLVEFMLTIPAAVVCRPGEPRRLMRRALAGLLPERVRCRRSKGVYDAMFADSFRPLAMELLHDIPGMLLVKRGYVDRVSLAARLERQIQGLDCNEPQLRRLIVLEFWLRSREVHPW